MLTKIRTRSRVEKSYSNVGNPRGMDHGPKHGLHCRKIKAPNRWSDIIFRLKTFWFLRQRHEDIDRFKINSTWKWRHVCGKNGTSFKSGGRGGGYYTQTGGWRRRGTGYEINRLTDPCSKMQKKDSDPDSSINKAPYLLTESEIKPFIKSSWAPRERNGAAQSGRV